MIFNAPLSMFTPGNVVYLRKWPYGGRGEVKAIKPQRGEAPLLIEWRGRKVFSAWYRPDELILKQETPRGASE
jgi:hypothetical protein